MVTPLTVLLREVARLRDEGGSNERSYYHFLQIFLKAQNDKLELPDIRPVAEESAGGDIGFPDITVRSTGKIVGWIEVKLPDSDLNHRNTKDQNQFVKYKDNLENIIFTNFRQWQLWQWNDKGDAVMTAEVSVPLHHSTKAQHAAVDALLEKFFVDHRTRQAKTPNQLAIALARKTKLLSQQALENFSSFAELREIFSKVLIQDLDDRQFANLIAETLTYSLFLAMLESAERKNAGELTLTTVIDFLPPNIPILRDLYDLFRRVARDIQPIGESTDAVLDELKHADLESIHSELARHKPDEDPVVNFYEPFLNEYDPQARKSRGVYYTPKPVVDFITDSVDTLLQQKFGKPNGLADNTVSLLDPSTGTGTFLMSAIQKVHERICKKYRPLGIEKEKWREAVQNHILRFFFAFELMVAPYTIAHLKLTLELERLGFTFDPNSRMRLQVLLANALDDPEAVKGLLSFPGFASIPQESEAARRVKNKTRILAIIGNPPYANFGMMNKQQWILDLLTDYKTGLHEKKINLDDDYIKFIRFAQWKLEKCGQGIFAMITANSFLDGVTHRQMRASLLATFDEIYIYNLHGNSRKKETCPDGSPDQNVFDIQTGVSINIFVRLPNRNGHHRDGKPCRVYSADAYGSRQSKFAQLREKNFRQMDWQKIDYAAADESAGDVGKLNFFIPQRTAGSGIGAEYNAHPSVTGIFKQFGSGVKTDRDELVLDFEQSKLEEKMRTAFSGDYGVEFARQYRIKNSSGYQFADKLRDGSFDGAAIRRCHYRPFDSRFLYYRQGFTSRPGWDTMQHMLQPNLGVCLPRLCKGPNGFVHGMVSTTIIDVAFGDPYSGSGTYFFPLYLYADNDVSPNINSEFISEFKKQLGVSELSPEEIFYYAYAVFHCPAYRQRYAEQLKIDFPRLPLTADKTLFAKLVAHGNRLVNLHLLGENPFDNTAKELFADTAKWGVNFAGTPPNNIAPGQIIKVTHQNDRVYINSGEYFGGITADTWAHTIGGYQVLDKWLKDRKKADRLLTTDDKLHYMKIATALRQTRQTTAALTTLIPTFPLN